MIRKDIFDLTDKVVLITGGSGYLGKAMSEILSYYGAILIMASRDLDKNLEYANQLNNEYGNTVICKTLDIADHDQIIQVVNEIKLEFNTIDVLINNSYYGAGNKFDDMSYEQWEKGIDGSIGGVFRLTQAVLPIMRSNLYGRIINIASMYGCVAPDVSIYKGNMFYNPVNYGVGKAGIIQFTKYIASVYGCYNITCNSISPGPFPSEKVQQDEVFIDRLQKKTSIGRIGKPQDLQGVIALLASDASSFINGTNIMVDGGWTAW